MKTFDRSELQILPLAQRQSKTAIEKAAILPETPCPEWKGDYGIIEKIATAIKKSISSGKSVILVYGAHLIKNGLGPILRAMVENGYVTHLATNGAGSIHDWEFAFQGKTEEDVRNYASQGQFGIWKETGMYINLAIQTGASLGEGYGESVGKMIHTDSLLIPNPQELKAEIEKSLADGHFTNIAGKAGMLENIARLKLKPGKWDIPHPFKKYSVQDAAFARNIPLTIHPGFGYDIIYSSPYNSGVAIGITSEVDFLRFVASVSNLEGGVYLSIGSAIMSPMIFEKSLSMARNLARQKGNRISDFLLAVNDIQEGQWQWGTHTEPCKHDPAYYLRFCKSFDRMEAREMHYICADNRMFLGNLYHCLSQK